MGRYFRKNNKKGSSMIFLSMILAGLIGLAVLLAVSAREKAGLSYRRTVTDIACRSVLSEYDFRLKDEYGIFAFRGGNKYVEDKIAYYLEYADDKSDIMFSALPEKLECDVKGFEITDTDNFEKQIIAAAKHDALRLDKVGFNAEMIADIAKLEKAELDSAAVICGLPSYGFTGKALDLDFPDLTEDGLKGLIVQAGDTFMANKYAFSVFNCRTKHLENHYSYFNFEIEYLICGYFSDAENLDKIKDYLVILRTPINIAKIYADSERSALALAEAEAIAPGPGAIAMQLVIITEWAVEDSKKDANKLMNGEKVDGLAYEDYLAIFLSLQDRETKLLRMMDLVQINMRKNYYNGFLLSEHSCGFYLFTEHHGKELTYVHTY